MLSKLWKIVRLTGMALITLAIYIRLAFAYVDPNTGGMLFQLLAMIFAFLTGILLFFSRTIQIAIARIKRMLRGVPEHTSENSGERATDE